MRGWTAEQVATSAGARLLRAGAGTGGPRRAVIDSRAVAEGDLFVGLPGARVDGGEFAARALEAGAWGVLVGASHAPGLPATGVVLAAHDPLLALQSLASAWRRALGAQVIAITGSVGKTSTKDLCAAMIAPHRATVASRANFNTEIGLPLEVLAAPDATEVLVLEMAMRGAGQIAELTGIAEPDVGVITNVGPVHLELLGSLEAIAAAKAELIAGLRPGATAVVPADAPLLAPHLRDDVDVVRFGPGGDVRYPAFDVGLAARPAAAPALVTADVRGEPVDLELPFTSRHMLDNALAALAAAWAIGVRPAGRVDVRLSALRGERVELAGGAVVVNDCYNANPLSMRAALDDLAAQDPTGRRIAVLGDMLELGPQERELHREIGAHAAASGVDVLVTVGPLAAEMLDAFDGEAYAVGDATEAAALTADLTGPGDLILVKASRGVGLEVVAEALRGAGAGA